MDLIIERRKIRLSGTRNYNDDLKSETGKHRIKTDSYQTFHEEHKLDLPVHEDKFVRTYDNGILTVVVPKVGTIRGMS